jgi:hypothetical protein
LTIQASRVLSERVVATPVMRASAFQDARILLTPKQLAAELSVAAGTLAKWRLSGTGPHYRKFDGSIRYDRADITEWVAKRRYAHTTEQQQDARP